jgi:ribonuclease P protein component
LRLLRTARLLRPADFAALRTAARRITSPLFKVEYRANAGVGPRLGMAVSRRVSKKAVVRNRIRRVIREQFRLGQSVLPDADLLFIARSACAERTNPQLRADLAVIFDRLAALKDGHAPGTMRADA